MAIHRTSLRRRAIQLVSLIVAVGLAVTAGRLVGAYLEGPGPVEIVKQATRAYATADCAALRRVSEVPSAIRCSDVRSVRTAYREEGLKPSRFTYRVVSRSGEVATVQITYVRDGAKQRELVSLEKRNGDWKVAAPSGVGG